MKLTKLLDRITGKTARLEQIGRTIDAYLKDYKECYYHLNDSQRAVYRRRIIENAREYQHLAGTNYQISLEDFKFLTGSMKT